MALNSILEAAIRVALKKIELQPRAAALDMRTNQEGETMHKPLLYVQANRECKLEGGIDGYWHPWI